MPFWVSAATTASRTLQTPPTRAALNPPGSCTPCAPTTIHACRTHVAHLGPTLIPRSHIYTVARHPARSPATCKVFLVAPRFIPILRQKMKTSTLTSDSRPGMMTFSIQISTLSPSLPPVGMDSPKATKRRATNLLRKPSAAATVLASRRTSLSCRLLEGAGHHRQVPKQRLPKGTAPPLPCPLRLARRLHDRHLLHQDCP